MTAKELAALIDGREIGHELTYDEERQAAESGLAALYVPDLDYAMISGAINGKLDDLSAFDRVYVTRDGIFASWRCNEDTRPVCPLFQWAMKRAIRVDTEFNRIGDPYCEFTADIPHVKFHTYLIDAYDFRQKEVFCVGIAFNVADLPGGCNGA